MTSMSKATQNAPIDQQQYADLKSALTALQEENQALKHELAWFKRQLFGVKSEKRLIDNPAQTGLLFGENLKPTAPMSLITLKAPPVFALMAPPEPAIFTLQTG